MARKVFHLPALVGAYLLPRLAAAGAGPLFGVQLVDVRGYGKVFEVGKMAPPSALVDSSKWLFLLSLRRNSSG
jgi:hypothetical protein